MWATSLSIVLSGALSLLGLAFLQFALSLLLFLLILNTLSHHLLLQEGFDVVRVYALLLSQFHHGRKLGLCSFKLAFPVYFLLQEVFLVVLQFLLVLIDQLAVVQLHGLRLHQSSFVVLVVVVQLIQTGLHLAHAEPVGSDSRTLLLDFLLQLHDQFLVLFLLVQQYLDLLVGLVQLIHDLHLNGFLIALNTKVLCDRNLLLGALVEPHSSILLQLFDVLVELLYELLIGLFIDTDLLELRDFDGMLLQSQLYVS